MPKYFFVGKFVILHLGQQATDSIVSLELGSFRRNGISWLVINLTKIISKKTGEKVLWRDASEQTGELLLER